MTDGPGLGPSHSNSSGTAWSETVTDIDTGRRTDEPR